MLKLIDYQKDQASVELYLLVINPLIIWRKQSQMEYSSFFFKMK